MINHPSYQQQHLKQHFGGHHPIQQQLEHRLDFFLESKDFDFVDANLYLMNSC